MDINFSKSYISFLRQNALVMESSSVTTLLLALVHILLELPHVGFENRSYTALLIHVAYHVTSTFIQLFLFSLFI